MTASSVNDFGVVAEHGDTFEFQIDAAAGGICRLVVVDQTERGARRSEIAEISGALWRKVGLRAARELAQAMSDNERTRAAPSLKHGTNRLSPLVGRELALLLWALQEEGAEDQLEAILHGWRELAREERWWLFAKAAAPGQRTGTGWRRALFHALSEAQESRAEPPATKKKSLARDSISRPTRPSAPNPVETDPQPNVSRDSQPVKPRRKRKKDGGSGGDPQIDLF